jgi:hypothetical protein
MGKYSVYNPLVAIRKHCLDCCSTYPEVARCTVFTCTLYPFRFGKRPETIGISEKTIAIEAELYAKELEAKSTMVVINQGTKRTPIFDEELKEKIKVRNKTKGREPIKSKCSQHPNYKGVRRPKSDCAICWKAYNRCHD